ncbi:DUF6229 family protein [Nonomuraea sp. NPDC050404]|uniref:DUF6229 family protein n=1 Tax=Nonomuraea sp. NPDC050404 TaxID=3155783 RepID=UPI0033F3AB81
MARMTAELAGQIVAGWRGGPQPVEGWDSPAGPLFSSGDYAEADITMEAIFAASGCTGAGCPQPTTTQICGSACTYSLGRQCC